MTVSELFNVLDKRIVINVLRPGTMSCCLIRLTGMKNYTRKVGIM